MTIRVLGYVMARNEWPLLGLAITHGFHCGIDHIVVVDHASTDETSGGLKHLQTQWPGRLTVFRLELDQFLQEITKCVVMSFVGANVYDWVYVFDADEFILISGKVSLPDLLTMVAPEVQALRYELQQWVAPHDMNDQDLSQYLRIKDRAIACVFLDQPATFVAQQIQDGHINFFDLPFPSKLIVRGKYAHKLAAGAHRLTGESDVFEQKLPLEILRVGHLPLLSWRRINMKSAQGKSLIDGNFPSTHGWQNQMIYHLDVAGELKLFWKNHSISVTTEPSSAPCAPKTVDDNFICIVLKEAIKSFMSNDKLHTPAPECNKSKDQFQLDNLVTLFNDIQSVSNQYKNQADALHTELAILTNQVTDLSFAMQSILNSNSWRLTKPMRYLLTKARSLRSSLARRRH